MAYAVLVALLLFSSASLLWFRHLLNDSNVKLHEAVKRLDEKNKELEDERAAHAEDVTRLNKVALGHLREVMKLEKDLHEALLRDPVHAGEYVRGQLYEVPENSDTSAYHIVPDPAGPRGGGSKGGGST